MISLSSVMQNSTDLIQKLGKGCAYSFGELKKLCEFTETELCLAILYLIRSGQLRQYREENVVYQRI